MTEQPKPRQPKPRKYNRFDQAGVYTCIECGKKTRNTGEGAEVGMCKKCYREAEQANATADGK